MKIIVVLILIILLCMILTGCRAWPHSNNEVKKYVEENISTSSFIISDAEDDGIDKCWQIYFEDKPDYIFQVFSQKTGFFGTPMGYVLLDNFDFMFSYYYLNEFNQTHTSTLYATADHNIEGHYTKDEVRIFANDIQEYCNYSQEKSHPAKLKINCVFVNKDGNELNSFYLFFDKINREKYSMLFPFSELITEVNEENIENILMQHIEEHTKLVTDFNYSLPELNERRKSNGLKPLPPRSENETQEEYWDNNN